MNMRNSKQLKAVQGLSLDRLSATLHLDAPVSSVPMVSAQRAGLLGKLSIKTVRDLLQNYPLRYIDMSLVATIADAPLNAQCTIVGTIYDIKTKRPRPKLSLIEITLVDETGTLMITCFNQPWLTNTYKKGQFISVSGKTEFNYGFKRMVNPLLDLIGDGELKEDNLVIPVHPTTGKLSRALMRHLIANGLEQIKGLYDPLPLSLRVKYRLCSRYQAFRSIHAPRSLAEVHMAKRRLLYEELLYVQLSLQLSERKRVSLHPSFEHEASGDLLNQLKNELPFSLSDDQEQAIAELLAGMASKKPINHLLLGDVGTGKTIVSAFGLVGAVQSGYQAVMIGPTEVLVRQYAQSLGTLLTSLGISWGILTASTSSEERSRLIEGAAQGTVQVLFGTHALLEDDIQFKQCSFVCIDEQQRFGVEQRRTLIDKAPGADVLSMTATPIPRSLALAVYGNMSISFLRQKPAHQLPRKTHVCHFSEEGIAYDAVRSALARGEQAYIICPLIGVTTTDLDEADDEEESSGVEYSMIESALEQDEQLVEQHAVVNHAKILQSQVFPAYTVGVLHGQLSLPEKNDVMEQFRKGAIDVLVSTTVIEVGVDVPNATTMIIEDADRFGLAQLHQLRGRVGRGSLPGEVFLVSRSKNPVALERLAIMEDVEDGFALSKYDLQLRREGDILGARQHGVPPLKLVNVIRDEPVIEAAYRDAQAILDSHEDEHSSLISHEEYTTLIREVMILENR